MNEVEELMAHYNEGALSQTDLFIYFFRQTQHDFPRIVDALPETMRADFFLWAREFCEGGGQYIMADGHQPIANETLRAYETWARTHGKW